MKRFTETTRFEDPWYRKLTPAMKLAWEYLYAKCDNAGVIDLDREGAEFHIGATVDWSEFLLLCGPKRIAVLENGKWWLLKFIEFQYGKLSNKSAPHRKVLSLLEQHGLLEGSGSLLVGYMEATSRLKEKDKDKEEDKEEDKEKEARPKSKFTPPSLDQVTAYCAEKKYSFDPEDFIAYYGSQNWKKSNGQRVSSWQLCCRTFENNQQKSGKQSHNGPQGPAEARLHRNLSVAKRFIERDQ
jgi:hypothetical protein